MPHRDNAGGGLKAKLRGLTANGKVFLEEVTVRPITRDRAAITDLKEEIGAGEVVGMQIGTEKARVRVSDSEIVPGSGQRLTYIRLVAGQRWPWDQPEPSIPSAAPVAAVTSAPAALERRARQRYKLRLPVEIRRQAGDPALSVQTSDLSLNGCYVEMLNPLPRATTLLVTVWLDAERITVNGIVRTSDAGVGIGIEFLDVPAADSARLNDFLGRMNPLRVPMPSF